MKGCDLIPHRQGDCHGDDAVVVGSCGSSGRPIVASYESLALFQQGATVHSRRCFAQRRRKALKHKRPGKGCGHPTRVTAFAIKILVSSCAAQVRKHRVAVIVALHRKQRPVVLRCQLHQPCRKLSCFVLYTEYMPPVFKRILLKLSGEALAGTKGFGVETERIHAIAAELAEVQRLGVQIAIVVGGGNFFRGVADQARHMDRVSADHMGMLATVINALALQDALEKAGVYTRVMSAIEMNQVAEPFIRRRAIRHLEKERVVIFAAGTGSPYFSTDSAASLRAMEIKADAILKGTKVDGIYDADPVLVKDAKMFDQISYLDILKKGLKVMDSTAISLCRENNLPIVIFNLNQPGNIRRVVAGEKVGSPLNSYRVRLPQRRHTIA